MWKVALSNVNILYTIYKSQMNPQPEQIDHCKHVKANFHLFDEGGKDGPHHLVGFLLRCFSLKIEVQEIPHSFHRDIVVVII